MITYVLAYWENVFCCSGVTMNMKMKNSSYRYGIHRPRPKHGHKYTEYNKCVGMMKLMYIKQHLSNIWSSIQEKVKEQFNWFAVEISFPYILPTLALNGLKQEISL